LDDLKARLPVGMVPAVAFPGSAVTWDGSASILALGLAVGLVLGVVSLTVAPLARAHPIPTPEAFPTGAAPPDATDWA
jgi:hypothetical protein